jgi:hypothetical protein
MIIRYMIIRISILILLLYCEFERENYLDLINQISSKEIKLF